jgi:hypothetical protein
MRSVVQNVLKNTIVCVVCKEQEKDRKFEKEKE